jgi:hypothetical protein
MEWHIRQAQLAGATESQLLEAIEVGIEMGGGPATVSSRFALKVLDYYRQEGRARLEIALRSRPGNEPPPDARTCSRTPSLDLRVSPQYCLDTGQVLPKRRNRLIK